MTCDGDCPLRGHAYRRTVGNFLSSLYFFEHVYACLFLIRHRGGRRQRRAIWPLCHTRGPLFRHQGQGESATAAGPGTGAYPCLSVAMPSIRAPAGAKSIYHMGAIDKAAVLHYSQLSGLPTFPTSLSVAVYQLCLFVFLLSRLLFSKRGRLLAGIVNIRVLTFYFFVLLSPNRSHI